MRAVLGTECPASHPHRTSCRVLTPRRRNANSGCGNIVCDSEGSMSDHVCILYIYMVTPPTTRTPLKASKNPKFQKSKIPKFQNSKNPKIQKNLQIPKSKNHARFRRCEKFGIFGFLDFRSRCLITAMDKWATCAFLRVEGGGEHIYICTYII